MKPTGLTFHEYQEDGINWIMRGFEREGSSGLFLDPGLGKTVMTLEAFRLLKQQGKAKKMLVVAPLQVARATWPMELYKWLNFNGMTWTLLHGTSKDREATRDVDIYIINYEGLKWLFSKKQFWQIDMIVFDELTRMKSWTSARVKMTKPFLNTFKYRLGLTGTPIPNGYEDIFSQTYVLDQGRRFGRRKTKFMDAYFEPATVYSYKRQLKPYAEQLIMARVDDLFFSLKAEDWIKLPKEIINPIYLELPPKLMAEYKELKKEAILELQQAGKTITAQTAAVLTTKLRQFLSGNIYVEGGVTHIHSLKFNFLKEFIEDLGSPILIAYQYRHEAQMLLNLFPSAVAIGGGTPQSQLAPTIARWNAGNIPILIGHPQSIGHGLNLQGGGNHVMFFSLDYNLETYQQFIKRVSRQGQSADHVVIHHLMFANTIDEHIMSVLQGKSSVQKDLLDYLVGEK